MRDILQDVVSKTHVLGFLNLIKVNSNEKETTLESMADDRSVILYAKTHQPVEEFDGVFGMTNLEKLNLHLKNPEYKEDAEIRVVSQERNGETVPTHIHFENSTGDFQNDYRFMSQEIIEQKLKSVRFKGASWEVEFEPTENAIYRMKLMSQAHSDEPVFTVKTENSNLVFSFGDESAHAGEFVFQPNVNGNLSHSWSWPVSQVQSILNLSGDKTMKISDQGAMSIVVDSGLASYEYILPAQSK